MCILSCDKLFFLSTVIYFVLLSSSTSTSLFLYFLFLIKSLSSSVFRNLGKYSFHISAFSLVFIASSPFFVPNYVKFMLINFLKLVYALILSIDSVTFFMYVFFIFLIVLSVFFFYGDTPALPSSLFLLSTNFLLLSFPLLQICIPHRTIYF